MNKHDLHNVCILAIEGYGEQDTPMNKTDIDADDKGTAQDDENSNNDSNNNIDVETSGGVLYRGKRTWKDSVGGATVCCNQCCCVLGYASIEEPDTCRLLKHRLCAKMENKSRGNLNSMIDCFSHNTCGSFIARELTRYAESQAVFTFVISNEESAGKILLFKLLSWNTSLGLGERCVNGSKVPDGSNYGNDVVKFGRIAKVIFEEIDDPNHHSVPTNSTSDTTDPMNFSWGNFDECCPPFGVAASSINTLNEKKDNNDIDTDMPNAARGSKASVQIHLTGDEWNQLRETAQKGTELIPYSISQATVLLKLGNTEEVNKGKAALSILQLPFIN